MPDQAPAPTRTGSDWRQLWDELVTRTVKPGKSVPFVFYVVLGPFLFGALGVWVEIFKLATSSSPHDYQGLITAVCTYFPALGCSTALQLVLASTGNNDKRLVSFAHLLLFVFFLAPALLLQAISVPHPRTVLAISALCSVVAIWLWWITNGSDPTYLTPSADAATGGEVNRPLPGNLAGYQV